MEPHAYAPGDAVTATSFGASEPSDGSGARSVRDRRRRRPRPWRSTDRAGASDTAAGSTTDSSRGHAPIRCASGSGSTCSSSTRTCRAVTSISARRDRHRVGRGSGSEARVRVRRPAPAGRAPVVAGRGVRVARLRGDGAGLHARRDRVVRRGSGAGRSRGARRRRPSARRSRRPAVGRRRRRSTSSVRRISPALRGSNRHRRAPRCDPRPLPAGLVRRRRGALPVGDLRQERCDRGADGRSMSGTWRSRPTAAAVARRRRVRLRADVGRPVGWASRWPSPHDALDDALVTAQAFLVLAGRLPSGPEPTVADLSRLAGEPLGPG